MNKLSVKQQKILWKKYHPDQPFNKEDYRSLTSWLDKQNVVARIAAMNLIKPLDPLFKWTGGKRREIKHFGKYFPSYVVNKEIYTYVEPFAGGAAVYWHLNNLTGKNVINEFDGEVVNFYEEFRKSDPEFVRRLQDIGSIKEHNVLESVYYELRDKDRNNGLQGISSTERAIRFFVVNQLAFSGMRRFNSKGEFNVPFGHYKGINTEVITSRPHLDLIERTDILQGDFELAMRDNDNPNTFCFLDPPYTRVFKEYSSDNSFGEDDHRRLAKTINDMKNMSVMLVIDKSPFTEDLYKGMIKSSYSLKYGVNIKNRFSTDVQHLIICNY